MKDSSHKKLDLLQSTSLSMLEIAKMKTSDLLGLPKQQSANYTVQSDQASTLTAADIERMWRDVLDVLGSYSPVHRWVRPDMWEQICGVSDVALGVRDAPKMKTLMTVHNASDKFIEMHSDRIRKALLHVKNITGIRSFYIMTIEPDGVSKYPVALEVIDHIPEMILSPATDRDLAQIAEWEERNKDWNPL